MKNRRSCPTLLMRPLTICYKKHVARGYLFEGGIIMVVMNVNVIYMLVHWFGG